MQVGGRIMSRRTSFIVPDDVDEIIKNLGSPKLAPLLWDLLREHHHQETTGDIWVGTGPWRGWRLTTAHSASIDGQPVLIGPDGVGRGANDI
ncbi:hypothetical protein N9X87_00045 [bacterium]|nr:hypothetical protein [bacterium]